MFASFSAHAVGRTLPAERSIDLAAAAGFAGVDLLVRDLKRAGADPVDLRDRLEARGLRGGAWPLPVRWRDDEATYRADLRELPALAAIAARLGLLRTGTWVLPEAPVRPDADPPGSDDRAEVVRFHEDRLGAIAGILADHGIRLGLEVIGVESSRAGIGPPFVTRLSELGDRLGTVLDGHGNVGILLDAFHLAAAGEGVDAALAWGADRVVWVHVADVPVGVPGDRHALRDDQRDLPGASGRVDVGGILHALAGAGYDGPVTVETRSGGPALAGLADEEVPRAVADSLRPVWPGMAVDLTSRGRAN